MQLTEVTYFQTILIRQCSYDVIITPTTIEKRTGYSRQLCLYGKYGRT